MKFKNIKANIIEETDNKDIIEQMKKCPEVYQPIEEKAKPAAEAKPEKEAPKAKK